MAGPALCLPTLTGHGGSSFCRHNQVSTAFPCKPPSMPAPPRLPQLRRAYPSAAIINLVWPLEQLTAGVLSRAQAQRYQQWMAAAFERLRSAGVGNVHMLQVCWAAGAGWAVCCEEGTRVESTVGPDQFACGPDPLPDPLSPTLTPHPALQLSGAGLDSKNWCGAHPDVAAHAQLAPQLEQFIRSILPSWQ